MARTARSVMGPGRKALREAVLRPVKDRNVFESTVEQLAASIRLGIFISGERLPSERDLTTQLGVSRVTIREAIGALREAGFVATEPGRGGGSFVIFDGAQPDSPDRATPIELSDLLDFRRIVEGGTAYVAASGERLDTQIDWLRSAHADVLAAGSDRATHRMADARLHLAIATVAGNAKLIEAITGVQDQLGARLAQIPVLPRNIDHSHAQHHAVIDAIAAREPMSARAAMEDHCDATAALLRSLSHQCE